MLAWPLDVRLEESVSEEVCGLEGVWGRLKELPGRGGPTSISPLELLDATAKSSKAASRSIRRSASKTESLPYTCSRQMSATERMEKILGGSQTSDLSSVYEEFSL